MTLARNQEAADQLDLARAAFDAQLFDQAQIHLRRVLELDPAHTAARILEARLRLQQNLPSQALKALDSHDLYHPDQRSRPDITLLRAQSLTRCDGDEMAMRLLEKLAMEFPDDVRPHRMIGAMAMKLGLRERAIAALHQVLRLESSDRPTRMNLARLLGETDPQEAIDLLLQSDCRADLGVQVKLARLYQRAGRLREADETYAALLAQSPDAESLWLEAGELADSLGDHARAIDHLRRAAALSRGKDGLSLTKLALAHMHAGEVAQAGRCWWRALRRDPDHSRAWAGLLICALAAGRARLIRRALKMLTVQTGKKERQKMLGELWQHLAGGLVIHRTMTQDEAAPHAVSPLEQLLHKAEQTLEENIRQRPQRADMHYHLATCRDALANDQGAGAAVDRALAINPDYAAAVRLRARLLAPSKRVA